MGVDAVGENPKDLIGAGKPPLNLIPASALIELSVAMRLGAAKYGAYNWRAKKVQLSIYLAAGLRHILSYNDGEDIDAESGVSHLANGMACLAIAIDAVACGCAVDDRPHKGVAAELIERHTTKNESNGVSDDVPPGDFMHDLALAVQRGYSTR